MIHPKTELKFISEEVGYGVIATEFIPKGTITWVMDKMDQVITPAKMQELGKHYQDVLETYTFRNNKGNYILCWDHGKYVNHSFKSNCLSTAYDFEIAIKDIQPGEQLTDDYGYLNIIAPFRAYDEGTKRKVVYPDDLTRYASLWDGKVNKVIHLIQKLPQPLQPFFEEENWKEIVNVAEGKTALKSIANNYFPGETQTQK